MTGLLEDIKILKKCMENLILASRSTKATLDSTNNPTVEAAELVAAF